MATQLVTPEAVVLGFDTAGLPTRLLARLMDVGIQLALLFAVLIGLGFLGAGGVPDVALTITVFFLGPLIILGYPIVLESLWRGKTPGKAVFGLRVVTVEGAPIRFRHALIRGAADIVDLFGLGILLVAPGVVGIVAIAASKRNQRLGDMVAGTIVVRERSGATPTAATGFAVPQGWEAYASTVDVSGLSGRDYQAVRSYLLRAPSLRADARQHVAVDLARSIAGRIHHTPPPGIHPDLFLTVVAANVQARGARPAAPSATRLPAGVAVPGGWGAVPAWPGSAPLAPDADVPLPAEAVPATSPSSGGGFAIPG